MRRAVLVTAVLALLTSATACASAGVTSTASNELNPDGTPRTTVPRSPTTTTPFDPRIEWTNCTDPAADDDPALTCATITVPLDYATPAGDTIGIALVRVKATKKRIGAILFNPGGPGGSGFDFVAGSGTYMVREMGLEGFDLIGFDPRGVDRSNGIRCLTDAQRDRYAYVDGTPDTPDEQALYDEAEALDDTACRAKYGDTLRHYSTENTARDMDLVRRALGDTTISYIGISYGTFLGATYATLFPEHVRAMVLDAAYEPTGDSEAEQYMTQLVGFENAFSTWATWCQTTADCAFRTADVGARWDALLARLDATPFTSAGRTVNNAVMETATIATLYSEDAWPALATALVAAEKGDGAGLLRLADDYIGRTSDGTFNTLGESGAVIRCASGIRPDPPADPAALAAQLGAAAPRFGKDITAEDFTDGNGCDSLMPAAPKPTIGYDGKAPIVVVGGTNDPATPFRWATELTAAMGPSAVLLTYTGEGHGAILSSTCATEIEAAVIVSLKVPKADTTCGPDPVVEKPAFWDSMPVPARVEGVFASPEVRAALGLSPTQNYAEMRLTSLAPEAAIAAYDAALRNAGFRVGREHRSPLTGSVAGDYLSRDGKALTIVALGTATFADPDFAGLGELVPAGTTLLILLHTP